MVSGKKFERIYQDLLGQIQSGQLKEGQTLPPEIPLAKQYGVAVLTLRRALAKLREEGWIISRRYHGTKVCNPATSALFRQRNDSKTIGIFASAGTNALTHPAHSRLINGMEGVLTAAGYSIDIAYCDPDRPDYDKRLQKKLVESTTQGWLIPSHLSPAVRDILKKRGLPIVLMHYPDESLTDHIFEVDFQTMAQDLLAHLLQQDYRNIWLFTPPSSAIWSRAIEKHAATSGMDCTVQTLMVKDYNLRSGQIGIEQLLSTGKAVDAVVCTDDEIAVGAMQALMAAGKPVPEIAVIGGGDFPIGSLVTPRLTTIFYPYYTIGREAASLLIDLVEDVEVPPTHRVFRPKLIVRESSNRSVRPSTDPASGS